MPRRIPIRAKLACALAVPLAGLVGGAAFQVADASRIADEARSETDLATTAVGPASLVSQLQNERNFSSVDLIGQGDSVRLPVSSVAEAREATDAALEELREFVSSRGAEAEAAFADGLAAVEAGLAQVRATVDGYTGPRTLENNELGDEVFLAYADIVAALLDGTAGIALQVDDARLRTGVELVDLTTRLYEQRSVTLRTAVAYVLAGDTSPEARLDIAGRLREADALEETIVQRAVEPYDGFAEFALNDAFIIQQEALMRGFATNGELDVAALLGAVESGPDRGVLLVRRQASDRLLAEADAVLADADEHRRTMILVGGGLVAVALALTYIVSRSITRPLASLTAQAEAMAGEKLPAAVKSVLETPLGEDVAIPEVEPIAVRTRDEVREVAAALNVVQQSALDLAVEQAVLRRNIADSFVNMGRRNQNLLDRQLDFITELEREEQEPDRLASLFRLDHLATRMRRNAESLLRLAGSEPQRQMSAPIDIGDVVRGALGEVEDYQRVQVRGVDPAAVPGGVGADLAHALAELIENALSFSPPSEPVEVRGRRTPDGYVIAVSDSGLGMTPDELAVANRRLAGEESFTVAPSRYLGHYVAGYLASRLGVRIELQPGPAGGLVARVDVPASVLIDSPAEPRPLAALKAAGDAADPAAVPDDGRLDERSPAAETWMASDPSFAGAAVEQEAPAADAVPAPARAPHAVPDVFTPSPAPANGFGGLAPVAASAEGASVGTTASGLVRRVPGAQHPTTEIGSRPGGTNGAHGVNGADRAGGLGGRGEPDDDRMTADAVSSFLSDFNAGVTRGIAEAGHNPWEDGDEPR